MTYAPIKAFILAPVLILAPAAIADPVQEPPNRSAQIKPLDKADIDAMAAQMPDFNKMIAGLQSVMADPKVRGGLKAAAGAAGKAMDGVEMSAKTDTGMPDMNAMMGTMLALLGDEELMGGLSEALSAASGPMEQVIKEAAPAAKLAPAQH